MYYKFNSKCNGMLTFADNSNNDNNNNNNGLIPVYPWYGSSPDIKVKLIKIHKTKLGIYKSYKI